uniref:Der1-like family, putative n=1 Tax=Theileria annulata TaxID=5874 RepID=A0A3B0MKD5_THEAN
MRINSLITNTWKLCFLCMLSSKFSLSLRFNPDVPNKRVISRLELFNPESSGGPSFAEIGGFFIPTPILDKSGNNSYSYLQHSTTSLGVDHDVVKLSKESLKFRNVEGLIKEKPLTLIVGTTYGSRFDMLFEKIVSKDDNKFEFSLPKGTFYIKTEGSGYFLPGVKKVVLPCKLKICPFVNDSFKDSIAVELAKDDGSIYTYNWKLQDESQFGVESINKIPQDEASILSPSSTVVSHVDASDASAKLKLLFGIELHGVWGSEYANRLLSVFLKFDFLNRENSPNPKKQKWLLTDESLYPQDIEIIKNVVDRNGSRNKNQNVVEDTEYEQIVKISREAFKYSMKQAIDKKKNGFYFSRRLYKSVIRAICLHNPENMKKLFKDAHNVVILEPFELEHMIRAKNSFTHYPSSHYQSWFKHPEELIEILTSWREYPSGLHKVNGLRYFLRRQDGMVNPEQPTAPAIAYPRGPNSDSYIEFMESGFHNYHDVSQLILHEIGHFIHFNTVPEDLKTKWIELGGWYEDPKDPDGWSTRKQTEFVSAYSHQKNPGEDFASTLADYVLNPKLVRSRALQKFMFIKDNIMGGVYYLVKASHEFKVLNLGNADYFYPGRLSEINVVVNGKVNEPKKVKLTFKLLNKKNPQGEDSDTCAKKITFRLFSEIGTFEDIVLKSISGCSHVLETEITINQMKKRGVWTTDQIVVTDDKGLQRFVGSADFGLRVWINNGSEDFQDPRALTNSVSLALVKKGDEEAVRVGWLVVDDSELRKKNAGYAAINGNSNNQHSMGAYSRFDNSDSTPNNFWRKDVWSGARKVPLEFCSLNSPDIKNSLSDPNIKFNTHKLGGLDNFEGLTSDQVSSGSFNCFRVALNIPISKSSRTGDYFLTQIVTYDSAGNSQLLQWPQKTGPFITYTSSNPNTDNSPPTVKDIRVTSRPSNPNSPNGETLVEISFNLCDSGSGISSLSASLRDPFGATFILYPSWSKSEGCQKIVHTHVLPKGSIPGIWHLSKIYAQDFAGNELSADLTELLTLSSCSVLDGCKTTTCYLVKPINKNRPSVGAIKNNPNSNGRTVIKGLVRSKSYATIPSTLEIGDFLDSAMKRLNPFNLKSFFQKYDHIIYHRFLRSITRIPPLTGFYVLLSTITAFVSYFFNDNLPFSWMKFDLDRVLKGEVWRLFTPYFLYGQLWINHYMLSVSNLNYMANVELAHINKPEKFIEFLAFGVLTLSAYSFLEAYFSKKYLPQSAVTYDNMAFHFHVFVLYFWSRINEGQRVECMDFFSIPAEYIPYLFILQNLIFYNSGLTSDFVALLFSYAYFTLFSNKKTCPIFRGFKTSCLRRLYLKFRDEMQY